MRSWIRSCQLKKAGYYVTQMYSQPWDKFVDQTLPKYLRMVGTGWQDNLPDLFLLLFHGTESTQPWLVSFLGKKTKAQIRCDRLIAARCSSFGKQDRPCLSDEKCCWGRQTGPGDSEGRESEPGGDGGRYKMKMKRQSVGLSAVTFCK